VIAGVERSGVDKEAIGSATQELVAGEIDFRGGLRIEEGEAAVEQLVGEVTDRGTLEVTEQGAALEGGWQGAELGQVEASLGVHQLEVVEEVFEQLLMFLTDGRGA
jgi:hypothetical protein